LQIFVLTGQSNRWNELLFKKLETLKMGSNSIPPNLKDLLIKLEYLSMIERGKKPCMNDMTFVESTSWYGSLWRALNGENKRSMLVEIEQIVEQAISALSQYSDTEFMTLIVNALARARAGITNLAPTYQDHPHVVSSIKVMTANIDLQLDRNKRHIQGKIASRHRPQETGDKREPNTDHPVTGINK
jgi:hypothetical protein